LMLAVVWTLGPEQNSDDYPKNRRGGDRIA
jgi:hypothetical protein